jgi:hypothetical protein
MGRVETNRISTQSKRNKDFLSVFFNRDCVQGGMVDQ